MRSLVWLSLPFASSSFGAIPPFSLFFSRRALPLRSHVSRSRERPSLKEERKSFPAQTKATALSSLTVAKSTPIQKMTSLWREMPTTSLATHSTYASYCYLVQPGVHTLELPPSPLLRYGVHARGFRFLRVCRPTLRASVLAAI